MAFKPYSAPGFLPADNPISQWVAPRRNALLGFGAGMLSNNWSDIGKGTMQGMALDRDYALEAQEQAKEQEAQNATMEWLQSQGYDDLVQMAQATGDIGAAWSEGLKRTNPGAGNPESFFGTGIPIRNPDGSISYGQFGNQGSFNIPDLPDGAEFLTPVEQLNIGTGFVDVDKFGNRTGGFTEIDNFTPAQDAALGKVIGDAAAQKIIGLPQTLATADNMIGSIDGILNDPALDVSTGWLAWMQGVPGTEQYRFGQRALQLQGQAFLQAFESLKGGGQITEVEGNKATQAIGRLSTAQNPADYRQALNELKTIIEAAKTRAQQGAASVRVPGNSALGGPAPANGGTTSTGVPWSLE